MAQILQLEKFRNVRRKEYFKKFSRHLDLIILSVLDRVPTDDLSHLAQHYQDYCSQQNELAWDYAEFRDILFAIVFENLSPVIIKDAEDCYWFDPVYVSREYVTERTLSFIVLGRTAFAAEL